MCLCITHDFVDFIHECSLFFKLVNIPVFYWNTATFGSETLTWQQPKHQLHSKCGPWCGPHQRNNTHNTHAETDNCLKIKSSHLILASRSHLYKGCVPTSWDILCNKKVKYVYVSLPTIQSWRVSMQKLWSALRQARNRSSCSFPRTLLWILKNLLISPWLFHQ